jgi:predicted nuclease of restriction endonuclease-like RecB superfamily
VRFSLQDVKKQVQRRGSELYVSLHFLRPGELRAGIECLVDYHERLLGQPQRQFSQDEARTCIGDYRLTNCLVATLSAWYTWRQGEWVEAIQHLPHRAEVQRHFESAGITSPTHLRLDLFNYVNEHHQGFLEEKTRPQALQTFAASHDLDVSALEYLLALDSDEEAILVRNTPHSPTADEVVQLYNQWAFEAALSNASNVRFVIDCNAFNEGQRSPSVGKDPVGTGAGAVIKRLSYLARRLGVYYDLEYDARTPAAGVPLSPGQASSATTWQSTPALHLQLTLYGPQEMTGMPQQYGLRLARLCRILLGYGVSQQRNTQGEPGRGKQGLLSSGAILEADATVHFLQHSYRFVIQTIDRASRASPLQLLPSQLANERVATDSSSLYDSSVERSFAQAFSALESSQGVDGWQLEREPEPLLLEQGILIPDFALTRAGRRVYIEIIGFWTPAYRERKIQKLQQLQRRDDLVLAIPVEAQNAFSTIISEFPIVWYDGQLSATELLHVLRNHYDDFAERLARIDVPMLQERVRNAGLLSEQACYELLHCYRRSELQRAARQVVCADIAFATGVGLYQVDWLERLRRSLVKWIGAAPVAPLSLEDVLRECRTRWPMLADYEVSALEGLLSLCSEIYIRRSSIFDAVVEVSVPGPQVAPSSAGVEAGDTSKKRVRERRVRYQKRDVTEAVQGDLWGKV